MDDFECKIAIKPISEWVNEKEGCPPCLLSPLASYYLGVLNEAGETNLVEELRKTFEDGNVLTISKKLDSIKSDVGEAVRKQLRNLDCFAQTFKTD